MPLTGYLKIDEIPGASTDAQHPNQIDVWGARWGIEQAVSSISGRTRSRADMGPLVLHKYYDQSSPYLAAAVDRAQRFSEIMFTVAAPDPEEGLNFDYLVITMENAMIVSYGFAQEVPDGTDFRLVEEVQIDFEQLQIAYKTSSASSAHEVELGGLTRSLSLRGLAQR